MVRLSINGKNYEVDVDPILNALYRATGKRFRSVPLKNHDIQMV